MKLEIKVSEENEGTSYPWWLIIDPKQMMKPDVYDVAHMMKGPFFSRQEAQEYLNDHRHHFTSRAKVYCHSAYESDSYRNEMDKVCKIRERNKECFEKLKQLNANLN